jgi:hypothetical protein
VGVLRRLQAEPLPPPAIDAAAVQSAAIAAKAVLDAEPPDDARLATRALAARREFVRAADALSALLAEGGAAARRHEAVAATVGRLRPAVATYCNPGLEPGPGPGPGSASLKATIESGLQTVHGWQAAYASEAVQARTDAAMLAALGSVAARIRRGGGSAAAARAAASAEAVADCKAAWGAIEAERVFWEDSEIAEISLDAEDAEDAEVADISLGAFPHAQLRGSVMALLASLEQELAETSAARARADELAAAAARYRPRLGSPRPGIEELTKATKVRRKFSLKEFYRARFGGRCSGDYR